MDFEFNSLKELYEHIKPALEAKVSEMQRVGYSYIKAEDIWNYLKEIKWKKAMIFWILITFILMLILKIKWKMLKESLI